MDESHAEAHYLLGLCLRDASRPSDAMEAFENAVALSPGLIPPARNSRRSTPSLDQRSDELEQLQMIAGLDRTRPSGRSLRPGAGPAGHSELAVLTLGQALERPAGQPLVYAALGRVWLDIAVSRSETLPPPTGVCARQGARGARARRADG